MTQSTKKITSSSITCGANKSVDFFMTTFVTVQKFSQTQRNLIAQQTCQQSNSLFQPTYCNNLLCHYISVEYLMAQQRSAICFKTSGITPARTPHFTLRCYHYNRNTLVTPITKTTSPKIRSPIASLFIV